MKNAPFDPWRNLLVSARRPLPRWRSARSALGRRRGERTRGSSSRSPTGLLPQPLQPDPGAAVRRRLHLALDQGAALRPARARALGVAGADRRRQPDLRRHDRRARPRHAGGARPARPPLMDDRRVLERTHEDLAERRGRDRVRVPRRLPEGARDRPAGGLDLRLGPGRTRTAARTSRPRGDRAALRRGGLRRRHRRRPGRDGGGEPRLQGRRAASRSGSTSSSRTSRASTRTATSR